MKEFFPNVKTFLVPDIVAWMKYIPKQMPERQGVLLCMRKDKEKNNNLNKFCYGMSKSNIFSMFLRTADDTQP